MKRRAKSTTRKAGGNSSTKPKRGSRAAIHATTKSTTTHHGQESEDTSFTEEMASETNWSDIETPCYALIREKNVEGITDNEVREVIFDDCTINKDYFRIELEGWINTRHYDLVEYRGPYSETQPPNEDDNDGEQ